MKKIALIMAAVAGTSLAAFGQGQVNFNNGNANGFVATSGASSDASSSTAGYVQQTPNFTVELWALSGPASTTAGLVGLDAYGYLNPGNLVSDGFSQVALVSGTGGGFTTSGNNVAGTAGAFGAFQNAAVPGTVSGNTVLAVVAWTGAFSTFASADVTGDNLGILVFVSAIGPASPTPSSGDISTGWNSLQNSPLSAANGGAEDLVMTPVVTPEPTTLALAGLGGAALLAFRRRKA
jgi:hypothetical protein